MANILSRKLRVGGLGSRGFSSIAEACFIRGLHQDIPFPMTLFETLDEHESKFPLVTKIPRGGLISIEPSRPYTINDHWRRILFSGYLHSNICLSQKDSIVNAFDYNNVLKGLNLLAFRKLDRIEGHINCNHEEYCSFVQDSFDRFCGLGSARRQFYELKNLLEVCGKPSDEDLSRFHSFFLEDEELGNLYCDMHRLTRHELKHRNKGKQAKRILKDVSSCYSNWNVVRQCSYHLVLQFLVGSHSPVEIKEALQQQEHVDPVPGAALVDIHRIAVQHAIENNVINPAFRMYKDKKVRHLLKNFTRVELIQALRYMFPRYPPKALSSFMKESVFCKLQMAKRLPIPSIYSYESPDNGDVQADSLERDGSIRGA